MKIFQSYTREEEIANSITHGIGIVFGIVLLFVLLHGAIRQHNDYKIVSSILFSATLIFTYLASTLYHSISHDKAKKILHKCDHVSIYLLIAGSYTPLTLISLHGMTGNILFGVIWGLATCGIILKVFFFHHFHVLAFFSYLLMGWIALVAIVPLIHHLPLHAIYWLIAGGLFYTIGTLFYAWENVRFTHSIWHLFVLAGSVCHSLLIGMYIIFPS